MLDGFLAQMATGRAPIALKMARLRRTVKKIPDTALQRLIERGVLRREENRVLWVFGTRRYPMVENHEQQEVKLRIAALLMSDEIPDARDIVIVGLAEACGLLEHIFSKD